MNMMFPVVCILTLSLLSPIQGNAIVPHSKYFNFLF